MKRIIITGGPTNEPIDEVMKITNMSTGRRSVALGGYFLREGYSVVLILNNAVNAGGLEGENLETVWIETTDDMLNALKEQSMKGRRTDAVIHASAVGDYKSDFSFLLEDMASELFAKMDGIKSADDILKIMEDPGCRLDDSSKISSYQKNLTVKLGLTPKIIARLREWFPDGLLIGCKLLENVSKEELFDEAAHLCGKNRMDYILANDLAELREGKPERYLVTKDGFSGRTLDTPEDIFKFVSEKLTVSE
jgi:phosphopantothenate-cysteine ligase